MRKRSTTHLVSPSRIFEELGKNRGRPITISPFSRSDLKGVRVFRGDNGYFTDQTIVISGRRAESADRYLAICHTSGSPFTRGRGLSRVFYELPTPVHQDHEPWVTTLPIPSIKAFRFVRGAGDPERLLRLETVLGTTERVDLVLFGNLQEARTDAVRHILLHGALFSMTEGATAAPQEKDFAAAVDLMEGAKFKEELTDIERIDRLMAAKDIFRDLGRTSLQADCLFQIAKIVAANTALKTDPIVLDMILLGLALATEYYETVKDVQALSYINLLLRDLTTPRRTRIH